MYLEEPLITKSLMISVFQQRDCTNEYISWLNDPEINKFLEVRFERQTIASAQEHVFQCLQSDRVLFCKIEVLHQQPSMIGTCTLRLEKNHKVAEVGIMLGNRNYHGLGYAKEVLDVIKVLSFETLNIRKLYAKIYSSNIKSINLFKASGFVLESVLTDYAFFDGDFDDVLILSCKSKTMFTI